MPRTGRLENLESRQLLTAIAFTQGLETLPLQGGEGRVMQVVDLNQDSYLDLVIGTKTGTVDFLLGQQESGYQLAQSLQVKGLPEQLFVSNLNDDAFPDVLVRTDAEIVALMNQGEDEGQWLLFGDEQQIYDQTSYRMEVGSLNGDDLDDLVYGSGQNLQIRIGLGDGTFGEPLGWQLSDGIFHDFDVADLNADGFADIVATTAIRAGGGLGGGSIDVDKPMTILENDGTGAFDERAAKVARGISVDLLDFDRDGNVDILAQDIDLAVESSQVFVQTSEGEFVGGSQVSGRFRVESQSGARVHTTQERPGHGTDIVGGLFLEDPQIGVGIEPWRSGGIPHFADLDRDGTEEIVGVLEDSLVSFKISSGSLFGVETLTYAREEQDYASLGDFDGDGFKDIVSLSRQSGTSQLRIDVRWNGPNGLGDVVRQEVPLPPAIRPRGVYHGLQQGVDRTNDGIEDALFPMRGENGDVTLVLSASQRQFEVKVDSDPFQFADSIVMATGDVDGDGLVDQVLSRNSSADGVVLVNRGAARLADRNVYEASGVYYGFEKRHEFSNPEEDYLHLADVTGDSVLDLIYTQSMGQAIVVLPGLSPHSAGDVNRDGETNVNDIDLLALWTNPSRDASESSLWLDMTGDNRLDQRDLDHWISAIVKTRHGDLDLNGRVEFADFLKLSANFGSSDASYSQGDLNGDSRVTFDDFLLLSTNFGFDASNAESDRR